METTFIITNDRYSPMPEPATIQELQQMCEENGWVAKFEIRTVRGFERIYDERGDVVGYTRDEYEALY